MKRIETMACVLAVVFAPQSALGQTETEAITRTLNDYIEGTANGQPQRLRNAFHPDFNLYSVGSDSVVVWSGKDYIGDIREGEKNDRTGRIVSIDFVNDAASAKIEIDIPSRRRVYTDYLLLLKYQSTWKIVHKSFTYVDYPGETGKAKRIDEILSSYHRYDLFNGNVIVAQNGKEVLRRSYGKANFAWNVDNTEETKFRIGSLTKQFTALLILQLKQEGKLKLDDTIIDHLPWYFKNTGSRISIHQLLNMTSGLPNYTDDASPTMEREELAPREFALKYFKDTTTFEPGTHISYCNTGYYLLGLIIEAVTNKPLETVLQERIFDVLGMKHSGVDSPNQTIPRLAEGYTLYLGEYIVPHSVNVRTMTFAAGMIYSTVEDLFLWDQSFYSERLLDAESKKLMFTRYLPNYGYGVAINSLENYQGTNRAVTLISHDGGIGGYSSYMARIPEDSIFIVLLDNTRSGMRGGDLVGIANSLLPVLYDASSESPRPVAHIELMRVVKRSSVDQGIAHFSKSIATTRSAYRFAGFEESLNALGYQYMARGDLIAAIKVLKLNAEEFPQSSNANESLGEAYFRNRQTDLALRYFERAVSLDATNASASMMVERIKRGP